MGTMRRHQQQRTYHLLIIVTIAQVCGSEAFVRDQNLQARQRGPLSSFSAEAASLSPSSSALFLNLKSDKIFSESVYETIQNGQIAIIPDFLDASFLAPLKRDAAYLHAHRHFSTDALASYGTDGRFDPSRDRAVLKLAQWKNDALGDAAARHQLAAVMRDVRTDLATHLNRPRLLEGASVSQFGPGSTEISFTRFGPGAFLKRHVDEHHEELKGAAGWSTPTRRSLSWLVYLNEHWNSDRSGGMLRCYERAAGPPSHAVGARSNGDLQIGWLRAAPPLDPVERPVFLDAQYYNNNNENTSSGSGTCALYVDDPTSSQGIQYISKAFHAHPTLYVAGSEFLVQQLWMSDRRDLAQRFHLIEPPKSRVTDWLASRTKKNNSMAEDERVVDVPPLAGTLVVFDSVSLPHEVLPTVDRERWAASGWMHEDQQRVETHPEFTRSNIVV